MIGIMEDADNTPKPLPEFTEESVKTMSSEDFKQHVDGIIDSFTQALQQTLTQQPARVPAPTVAAPHPPAMTASSGGSAVAPPRGKITDYQGAKLRYVLATASNEVGPVWTHCCRQADLEQKARIIASHEPPPWSAGKVIGAWLALAALVAFVFSVTPLGSLPWVVRVVTPILPFLVVILPAVLILAGVGLASVRDRRRRNADIMDLRRQYEAEHALAVEASKKRVWALLLPQAYRHDPQALSAMVGYLDSQRATTWQQCTFLWEQECHYRRVEADAAETRRLAALAADNADLAARRAGVAMVASTWAMLRH